MTTRDREDSWESEEQRRKRSEREDRPINQPRPHDENRQKSIIIDYDKCPKCGRTVRSGHQCLRRG